MTFHVGQEVECIDDASHFNNVNWDSAIRRGCVYKIRWVGWHVDRYRPEGYVGVRLVGIRLHTEAPFLAARFRPLTETKSSQSFTTGAPEDSERWDNRRKVRERVQ